MKKGYAFLSNSTKPTGKENNSREAVTLSNVSRPCLEKAIELGYDVYFGTNRNNPEELKCELPIHLYDSHTYRSITALKDNARAYKNLYNLVKNNNIKVIHCNTPIGGMIGRLVGRKLKIEKVIYTVHGFHFYKGGSFVKNIIFKTAESMMAHWTDAIITMNQEDYEAAKKFKLKKGGKVYFVHGVGINTVEFKNIHINKDEKRKSLGLCENDIVLITVGDLTRGKNISFSLDIIAQCGRPDIKFLVCGTGPELNNLKAKVRKLGLEKQVFFLGFRQDIKELLKISDVFLFTSKREGLPRALMEAMASGTPCVVSNTRGNTDLIENLKGGYRCTTIHEYITAINNLMDPAISEKFAEHSLGIIKKYDIIKVKKEIENIYEDLGL